MKILIYGAGVIGCYLSHIFIKAEHDVTLLARGRWKEIIEKEGVVIKHQLQRKTTIDHPKVLSEVDEEQFYDAVFVVMQHQQMITILPQLSKINTPLMVFVGNNMSAPYIEKYMLAHSNHIKNILFGFQATGGRRENNKVICVRFGEGSMKIGGLDGEVSNDVKQMIGLLFQNTKYQLEWISHMDAWYRCHLAFILPVAYVCYANECNLRRSTHHQRQLLLNATNEAFGLLKKRGYEIEPPQEDTYYQPGIKRIFISIMILLMAKTIIGDLAASDHCRHAVAEIESLESLWMQMRNDYAMPNWDQLKNEVPQWDKLHLFYDK